MSVESVEEAKAELDTLPLVAAKLMTYELMPVTTRLRSNFCSRASERSKLLCSKTGEGKGLSQQP